MEDELLAKGIAGLIAILDGDKGVDCLASQFVSNTDDGSLGNGVVLNQGSLDLSCRQTVTGYVDDVVDTSSNPVEALVVTASTITSELQPSVSLLHFGGK